jgi:hypothetical protein
MLNKNYLTRVSRIFLVLGLCLAPRLSYADWGDHHFYGYHDHPHFGLHVSVLPDGYYSFWAGGVRYYYYDGLYYNFVGGDYIIVNPPIGGVVTTIPSDFQPALINGVTYYVNNGTYYIYTHNGYQVVSPPVVQTAMPVIQAPEAVVSEDSYTVNIPNNNGSLTSVIIKRSGNGFVGPQGEFYSDFPKVAQLKAMYVK